MAIKSSLLGAALLLASNSFARVLHESISQVPSGWNAVTVPADDQTITLEIGLTYQNLDKLEEQVYAVSTPGDGCYGQYLDRDEVNDLIKPAEEASDAVVAWLKSEGVTAIKTDGTWVTFATTVGNANKLLGTEFNHYEKEGVIKLRTTSYSLPEAVKEHVDLIHPTTYFGELRPNVPRYNVPATPWSNQNTVLKRQMQVDPSCSTSINALCLKQMYNLQNYTADPASGSKVAFGSFLNQSARYADLAQYIDLNKLKPQNFTKIFVNNATDNQGISNDAGEANLDVQNLVGVAQPLPVFEYLTGGSPPFIPSLDLPTDQDNTNEPYVPYYKYLLSKTNEELPQVITNSYGEPEQTVPLKYALRTCWLIAQMSARGITIFESSGDTGVGGACQSNDESRTPEFVGQFPSTCPFLTGVGGTQAISPEIAWTDSSGGFSDYWPTAPYQQEAVDIYFNERADKSALEYQAPFFNKSGRAFPDVSAHSLTPRYAIVTNGRLTGSGGASAASPVWAALTALLNDARLRADMPALGFLNPWLYSDGYKALNDITDGGAIGCTGSNPQLGTNYTGSGLIPYASWNATEGWDPVTGLGTPDFQKLLKAVLAMKIGDKESCQAKRK